MGTRTSICARVRRHSVAAHLQSGIVAAGILLAAPAGAQDTDYEAIVRIMRECAKIADLEARATCYDNTVNTERLIAGTSIPVQQREAQPELPSQPPSTTTRTARATAGGFGVESLPPAQRDDNRQHPDEVQLAVLDAGLVEPGIYLLSLEDGSRWRFVDAVPWSYDTPRKGSHIELSRGVLGSFQMHFGSQRPVRIMRVQ